jgi:hypothetical protein
MREFMQFAETLVIILACLSVPVMLWDCYFSSTAQVWRRLKAIGKQERKAKKAQA